MTAAVEKSDIATTFTPGTEYPALEAQRVWLYRPTSEWAYSHHQSLVHFNGRYHAIWSNHQQHEDDVGQRVLHSTSVDFENWSTPVPLIDSQPGKHSDLVLTAAGFHVNEGTLVAYVGVYEYKPEALVDGRRQRGDIFHMDTTLWAMTTTDGENWSTPRDLKLPIVPNHPPQPTASGRLIISGNVSFPWTDDPAGLEGWTRAGCYDLDACTDIADDSEGFWHVQKQMGWEFAKCEGSFYQTDDGVLNMLLRSYTKSLWVSQSRDDGATWSTPLETGFSDCGTKFHFGRLPDGRFYYVGCPDPKPKRSRAPLVLSISADGVTFDRHWILGDDVYEKQMEGLHKGGQYGYPHTLLHDGYLHCIFSREKEAVEAVRVPLDELE